MIMKKILSLIVFLSLYFPTVAQNSFNGENSHTATKSNILKEKSPIGIENLIFKRRANHKIQRVTLPITSITKSEIEEKGRIGLEVLPNIAFGNTGKSHNPTFQIRGTANITEKLVIINGTRTFLNHSQKPEIDEEQLKIIVQEMLENNDPKTTIQISDVGKYLDENFKNVETIFTPTNYVNWDDYGYVKGQEKSEFELENLIGYYYQDAPDEEGKLYQYIQVKPINFYASVGFNYFVGKNESNSGFDYKYPGFGVATLNGGVSFNPCLRGGIQAEIGPALELYDGGSSFGFNARIGGFYDLKNPEEKIAETLYYGKAQPHWSLVGGFNYYNTSSSGYTTLSAGVRYQF
jgi:hypothetical protein